MPRTSPLRPARTRSFGLVAAGVTLTLVAGGGAAVASPGHGNGPATTTGPAGIERGEASMGWRTPDNPSAAAAAAPKAASGVRGIDVASHQGNVNWKHWWGQGKRFAYVKATEGTYYKNPYFAQQYNGSYKIGMIRGAYHFATPNTTSGARQANYFVDNGGGWSKDGKTLPGALDIEYNPYSGNSCFNMSDSAMVSWIKSFTTQYKKRTGRDAVIYTTTDWWRTCTGNTSAFSKTNPLWIARYNSSPGALPSGWGFHTIWQYSSSPIDQNLFNGSSARLKALANG